MLLTPSYAKSDDAGGRGTLLDIKGLCVQFHLRRGIVRAVDGVDMSIAPGESVALVGESGSGKSITAQSILRLLPKKTSRVTAGEILFRGRDLLRIRESEMRSVRGAQIAIVPQDPLASLNPLFPVGEQVANSFRFHRKAERGSAKEKAIEVLRQGGISSPQQRANQYPHELSGGMRQRVAIAMAIAADPSLLLADEPTTALDVTIQRQIIGLIDDIRKERAMALLFITHDLSLAAEVADRVLVMYAGRIVEHGTTDEVLGRPQHPYTRGLLASVPRVDVRRDRLTTISGSPPSPLHRPSGCPFHPRCPDVMPHCSLEYPAPVATGGGGEVACWLYKSS